MKKGQISEDVEFKFLSKGKKQMLEITAISRSAHEADSNPEPIWGSMG